MKNNLTPEIRFTGFTKDWDQRKLESIVDRVKSFSLSRDVETSEYTGYKYIHYGDIHTKVADLIDESSDLPNIKAGNYELLEKGDIVVADASEDYQGIATPAVITIDIPYKLVSGLHTIALRPKQVDPLFLYYLINSPNFRKYGYKIGTGMKVFGISVTNLLKFEGMVPLLEEQIKIGIFLKQLDDTIALYQQELIILKQIKQGFMQKMFPKEGESVPEIRFPEFTGDWEQRKLSDITDSIGTGKSSFIKHKKSADNPYAILGSTSIIGYDSEFDYEGDFILTARVGANAGNLYRSYGKVKITDNTVFIKGNNLSFLYPLLNNFDLKKLSFGTGQPLVKASELKNLRMKSPSFEEQTKIGNFFKQIDDTIALHQRELNALKETKKAFQQKMFV
ncbi:restriction endonuclease subunit S (plasmid) [Niallia taxi]|uniref:restriction endonuclease subunit S n=1 Tax=Niallia taxi TaxID=2499688 RepID=UPI002934E9A6|nr:restriction endonuclease subunit S [Niallia taxi]WOD65672.1 restriction endonuclease subunit S [Niallia taxi]